MFDPPQLHVSMGPHIHAQRSTTQIMWMVCGALTPALLWAVAIFGWQALAITLSSVCGAVVTEHLTCVARKRRSSILDGSAVCTGVLLAFTLPPGIAVWKPFLGSALAMFFAKSVFGGLGFNIFNIALIGRALMMSTFPVEMTTQWLVPRLGEIFPLDAQTMATPLAVMKEQGAQAALSLFSGFPESYSYLTRLFIGLRPGSIGEVSVVCVVLGALFLIWKGVIKLWIPAGVFAGVLLIALFTQAPLIHLFSGGVWLGAFFMATDYVTSPTLPKGQVIFGLGVGLLTGMIRVWGGYPEGICYAILIMNCVTPALNDWFRPARVSPIGAPS